MTAPAGEPRRASGPRRFLPAAVVVLTALLLRILALLSLSNTPYFGFLLLDERVYHDWAVKIAPAPEQSN